MKNSEKYTFAILATIHSATGSPVPVDKAEQTLDTIKTLFDDRALAIYQEEGKHGKA